MTASTALIPAAPDMVQTACFTVRLEGWELLGTMGYLDNRLPDDALLEASSHFREPGDYVIVSWPFETDFNDVFEEKAVEGHFDLRGGAPIALRREVKIDA